MEQTPIGPPLPGKFIPVGAEPSYGFKSHDERVLETLERIANAVEGLYEMRRNETAKQELLVQEKVENKEGKEASRLE